MARVRTHGFAWNALAVAHAGRTGVAMRALAGLGSFRTSGYPMLLAGRVESGERTVARAVLDAIAAGTIDSRNLARIIPIDGAVALEGDNVTEAMCEALEGEAGRLSGRSFYVRAHLRGMKGRLEHPAVERALGAFLYERAAALGDPPRVDFKDPDLALVIEVLGDRVGYAFIDREMRSSDLIRIR